MATWMEAPVEGTNSEAGAEIAGTLDGSPAEFDPWIVLDASLWPGASSSPRDVIPVTNRGPAQPSTGSLEPGHSTPRICDVIAAWRVAERQIAEMVEDDPDRARVQAALVSLRTLHHELFEARMRRWPREASARWTFAIMAWGRAPSPARVLA
jgi:hypothetical protein